MERSTDRTRHWAAWAGTKEDVRRLGNSVARQADSRLKALVVEFDKKTERPTDSVESFIWPVTSSDLTINSDTVLNGERMKIQDQAQRESRKQEREKLFKDFETVMTLVHGNDTTKGPMGDVIEELDRRTLTSVRFSAGKGYNTIEVTTTRQHRDYGVCLRVVSSDIEWANQAYVGISEEIEKGKPKSCWLRSRLGRMLASFTTSGSIVYVILAILLSKLPAQDRLNEIEIAIIAFLGLFALFLKLDRFHDWLMPRFEIFSEGGNSIGTRHLMWVGGQIIAVLAGIIAIHLALFPHKGLVTKPVPRRQPRGSGDLVCVLRGGQPAAYVEKLPTASPGQPGHRSG